MCAICTTGEVESPAQLSLSYMHEEVHPHHIGIHHLAVNNVARALHRGSKGASSNVLYAVMALLGELDAEALKIVKTEVDQRLAALKGPPQRSAPAA